MRVEKTGKRPEQGIGDALWENTELPQEIQGTQEIPGRAWEVEAQGGGSSSDFREEQGKSVLTWVSWRERQPAGCMQPPLGVA